MIFNLWPRVLIRVGDERHVFDRSKLMFSEVVEIEKVTGLSYAEWEQQLGRYSITAVAALIHVLRIRDGQPSDFRTMQFAAADLDVVPLHDDDTEYTPDEATAELTKRLADASGGNGAGPTRAADGQGSPSGETGSTPRQLTNPSSPNGSTSGPSNGTSSPTGTSSSARSTSTTS